MKIHVLENYEEMSVAVANYISAHVQISPESMISLPSGDSPTGALKRLVEYANAGKVDFSRCEFVGLDEWVGMGRDDEGSCQHYVYAHFFIPLTIPAAHVHFFDARAKDLKAECKKINDYLSSKGPLDLVMVGVGLNGHIGLNEPGTSFDARAHYGPLAQMTIDTGQKYFSETTKLEQGITLGIQNFMEARTVIVIASGEKKARIIRDIIEGPITESVPGSVLQRHPHVLFFLDKAAASQLTLNT